MKFSNLTPAQRSALAVLCNVGPTRTDKLAKSMDMTPRSAAQSLLAARKLGLLYSHQKIAVEDYAEWHATDLGRAVFDNRPHDVPLVVEANSAPTATASTRPNGDTTTETVTKYRVEFDRPHGCPMTTPLQDRTVALQMLEDVLNRPANAGGTGKVVEITCTTTYRTVARGQAPAKPTAQIQLL